jgi:hypothetical protein
MVWPPLEAEVLVIEDAVVVVVTVGAVSAMPSFPMAKYAVVPLVGNDCVKPEPAAVKGFDPLTVVVVVVQVVGTYNPTYT